MEAVTGETVSAAAAVLTVTIVAGGLVAKWAKGFFKRRRVRIRLDEAILGRPAEPGFDAEPGLLKDHKTLKTSVESIQKDMGKISGTLNDVLLGPDGIAVEVRSLREDVDGLMGGNAHA